MTLSIVPNNGNGDSDRSPFDAIRGYRADGTEYWTARELMHLFTASPIFNNPHKLHTHLEVLNKQECGLLILEACAAYSSNWYVGSCLDSLFLWDSAMSIYSGQSATMLFHAVRMLINEAQQWELSEKFMYPTIHKHADAIFGKCRIVDIVSDKLHIPDFYVSIGSDIIPVEVKRGEFSRSNLQQLQRYIAKYQPKGLGIAIAPSIDPNIKLPKGVRFIKLDRKDIYGLEYKSKLSDLIYDKACEILRVRLENQYV